MNRDAVAFFHPTAGAGGGGERVLWIALKSLQDADLNAGITRRYILYSKKYFTEKQMAVLKARAESSDDSSRPPMLSPTANLEALLELAKVQFGVELPCPIELVILADDAVETLNPEKYPILTLIRQTVSSGWYLFLEVMCNHPYGPPGILIDTLGVPMMYPLLSLICGTKIVTYVHYPVISSDMIGVVSRREDATHNTAKVARSGVLTRAKLLYYYLFSWLYWISGRFTTRVLTNSSWTQGHVKYMWGDSAHPLVVFPPCNVSRLAKAADAARTEGVTRESIIMSLGQFRPEKNHRLQIEAFARALPHLPEGAQLWLVGGARDAEDRERVEELKMFARRHSGLQVGINVRFLVSAPYAEVLELLTHRATVGLHTMRDEHFGICVVEFMAAGVLALAHNSAGPRLDIIGSPEEGRGELARTVDEFAEGLIKLMNLKDEEKETMRNKAKAHAETNFSDEVFGSRFVTVMHDVLGENKKKEKQD